MYCHQKSGPCPFTVRKNIYFTKKFKYIPIMQEIVRRFNYFTADQDHKFYNSPNSDVVSANSLAYF